MRRVLALVAVTLCVLAACSSDGGGAGRTTTSTATPPAAPVPPPRTDVLHVVTLNVLHGLFCPRDSDNCHASERVRMLTELLERAGCPALVGLQEIAPRQRELVPPAVAGVCGGYHVGVNAKASPDQAMVLSRLPVLDQGFVDLAAFPWELYWVRVQATFGPVDFATTHFASSSNNPVCTTANCPPPCDGVRANECNAREAASFLTSRPDPPALSILTGDFNAAPTSPTLATLTGAGFVDTWRYAGQAECTAPSNATCTGGGRDDTPLEGLDLPDRVMTERIDFVMARPGAGCELVVEQAAPFGNEPFAPPRQGLVWVSDHIGVQASLGCASAGASRSPL